MASRAHKVCEREQLTDDSLKHNKTREHINDASRRSATGTTLRLEILRELRYSLCNILSQEDSGTVIEVTPSRRQIEI